MIDLSVIKPGDRIGYGNTGLVLRVVGLEREEGETKPRMMFGRSEWTGAEWVLTGEQLDLITDRPRVEILPTANELETEQLTQHTILSRSFDEFQMYGGHANVYPGMRRWYFQHPRHGNHAFWLVTWPGNLLVTGDLDEFWWQRERDMLAWAARAVNDIDYFAGKAVRAFKATEWCEKNARRWVWEEWARRVEALLFDGDAGPEDYRLVKLKKDRSTLLYALDNGCGRETFWHTLYYDTPWDMDDPPKLTRWTGTYLWARSAVKMALTQLGYSLEK